MSTSDNISAAARPERPRTRRELAEAIFAKCDPVQIGIELLSGNNEKVSSVKARVWETLLEYQFGNDSQPEGPSSKESAAPEIIFRY